MLAFDFSAYLTVEIGLRLVLSTDHAPSGTDVWNVGRPKGKVGISQHRWFARVPVFI